MRHATAFAAFSLGMASLLAACSHTHVPSESDAPGAASRPAGYKDDGVATPPPESNEQASQSSLLVEAEALGQRQEAKRAIAQRRKHSERNTASRVAQLAESRPALATGVAPPAWAGPADRENYAHIQRSSVMQVLDQPVSTFSVDVDSGSYANVRRFLEQGRLPPTDAVRVEELINYFDYGYTAARDPDVPFSVTTEMAPTPWNQNTHLLHVGIQGWLPEVEGAGTNLVFLVDVSGSMQSQDKLPLVKTALKMLTAELGEQDRISLVVYAGASGVVLAPTPGNDRAAISAALDRLEAGGSTNGGAGIQLAYAMAEQGWIEGGVNRVLLATDGDFNVGTTRFESLLDLVRQKRKSGVALTTLGFGQGNYNDHLMEQLADVGDGNHAYIDSLQEAHKMLVRQRRATLDTIARDVKVQIEFNPAQVSEYRLIGYENRALKREDFANDAVDAGDLGAGHSVTALYEIALAGHGGESVRPLRYAQPAPATDLSGEIAHLRLRYKMPEDGVQARSRLIERSLQKTDVLDAIEEASEPLKLSAAVAAFGQLLSGGDHMKGFDYTDVAGLARQGGEDAFGDRAGFLQLVDLAGSLSRQARVGGGPRDESRIQNIGG